MSAFADKPRVTRLPGGPVRTPAVGSRTSPNCARPESRLMVLVTTLVGFLFGWHGPVDLLYLFHTLGGTAWPLRELPR